MTILLVLVPPLALLVLGFPIYLVILSVGVGWIIASPTISIDTIHQNLFAAINSYSLLAIPFFIYAGELMSRGSISRRIATLVDGSIGSVRGGLGVTSVGTTAIFSAISGSSAAAVSSIGRIMYPAMIDAKYPRSLAAGLTTAVGAIDIIIPPSVPMVVYALVASVSLPKLYAAGVFPGLLIAALLIVYVMWAARRYSLPEGAPFEWQFFLRALGRSTAALGAPIIILGGIYGGIFSPTEAAGVACAYAAAVTLLLYRELTLRDVVDAAAATVLFTGQLLIIAAPAYLIGWLMTVNHVASAIVEWLAATNAPTWALLLAINFLLLVVGCFIDPLTSILMFSPLITPVAIAAGIDPVHFGVIFLVNLAIGLFTPPFGVNIFIAQSALKIPLADIYRGIWPFILIYIAALLLITFVPAISLAGVNLFFRTPL
jgi:C4-dicarboxylate transporter DctM subunit